MSEEQTNIPKPPAQFTRFYILDQNDNPIPCPGDVLQWAKWFQNATRHIALDHLPGVTVSTVFLAIDHRFAPHGPPILWETMIFGGPHDGYTLRYTSKHDALLGHQRALKLAKEPAPSSK